jgi:hypothetical protein
MAVLRRSQSSEITLRKLVDNAQVKKEVDEAIEDLYQRLLEINSKVFRLTLLLIL